MGTPDNRSYVAGIAARYGTRLRRFLSLRLRNAADVPDLAQEVCLRLLRVDGYERIRSPEAYLFTIASHVIYQHAVRRASEPVLAHLPTRVATALVLHRVAGYSVEVADELGVSRETAKK